MRTHLLASPHKCSHTEKHTDRRHTRTCVQTVDVRFFTHMHSFDRADGRAVSLLASRREQIAVLCRRVSHHSATFACTHMHSYLETHAVLTHWLQGEQCFHCQSCSSDLIIFIYVFSNWESDLIYLLMSSWISFGRGYQLLGFLVLMLAEYVSLLFIFIIVIKYLDQ